MHMKRKSRRRREAIDWMLLVRDTTRLERAFQYLKFVAVGQCRDRVLLLVVMGVVDDECEDRERCGAGGGNEEKCRFTMQSSCNRSLYAMLYLYSGEPRLRRDTKGLPT